MRPGMFSRPRTMVMAGMVLSQPEMVTMPSNMWLRATSSTESAITSRLMREPFIPSVPMVMPSVMEMVLTSMGVPPAARIPCITFSASFRWFQLQGIVPIQECATPICGCARSLSVNPTAFIMARAGARSVPSRRTRLLLRGSLAISGLLCRINAVRAILQQVAEAGQRIALRGEHGEHGRQRLCDARARAGHAVGVVEIEDGSRRCAAAGALDLQRRARRTPSLRLSRPENARGPERPQLPEEREVGHAPRRPEEARGRSCRLRDRVVSVPHLAGRLTRPAEPQAPVAPGVIAEIVAGLRDAPDQRGRARRARADQEEGRLRAVGSQDVEDAWRLLGIWAVVEGEGDLALRSRSAPDASQRQQMRAPRIAGPGARRCQEPGRAAHEARSRASFSSLSTSSTMSCAARGRR